MRIESSVFRPLQSSQFSAWRVHLRALILFLTICASLMEISAPASAAAPCSVPGKDGPGTPSGVINTYYPGTYSVSAGATSIPVGAPSGDLTKPINNGDMLLVIQMQDADINYSNNASYGDGSGSGSGYTSPNQAGVYEYVTASGPVSGGYVPISNGLANSYNVRTANRYHGQSTFQVIRVPQYSTASVTGTVSALNWNGSIGGVVAMDVAGALTLSGTVSANGAGFRGGWGESSNTTGPDTDYRTRTTVLGNGMKGEGIAGTPNRMNQPTSFNGVPNQVTSGSVGYPNGTNSDAAKGRGAPANAGGGGTDGNTANDQNSGGGGGGNYAAGAKGGNSWSSNLTIGGEGGSAVSGLAFNRVVMGGGGGAGTTNNGTSDNNTYNNPAGLPCTAGSGACSSGAPGGGIILIRANFINGGGLITANGGSAYNVANDSAGGGGAGGSVVLDTQIGGSIIVYANGGDGGNAWRSQNPGATYPGERHGPGGAGSGGFVAYSPATGFAVSATVDPGTSGRTTTANDLYGSTSSAGGILTFQSPNAPGPLPGAECATPTLTAVKSASPSPAVDPGQVVTYTVLMANTATGLATNVSVSDSLSPYFYWGVNSIQFTNGSPSSGLTLGTPVYSRDNGATWNYVPVSGGGGAPAGYDANVTNFQIPMNGTMNGNGANFTINYRVRVK